MMRVRQLPAHPAGRLRPRSWLGLLAVLAVATSACAGATDSGTPRPEPSARAVLVSTPPVVLVPGTIDYTGTADVTIPLQNFLDGVPDGVVVRFRANGRYRVEGTLFVTNRNSLTFDGQNATIFATTQGTLERSQWFVTGGSGIIFRRLVVRGANPHAGLSDRAYNPLFEKQHGFRIEGTQGIELDHVTVTDVYGDFVYLARVMDQPATKVWVHDSTFRRNGRQGIAVVCATDVIIERNTFSDARRATIDLEPNGPTQTDSNIFILNNNVGTGRLLFVASHGKGPVNNVVITGNQLHKHLMSIDVMPLPGQRRKNWVVQNNTSDITAHSRPVRFMLIDGLLMTGNTQLVSDKQTGVELDDVCTGRIEHNNLGTGKIRRVGPTCSAQLVIPKQPQIPGRS